MNQDILERLQAWLDHETLETDPAAVVQEAAKEIKRLRDQWEIRGHVMDSIADLFARPRWIPVNERLPDTDGEVLLYVDDYGDWITKGSLSQGGWYVNESAEGGGPASLTRFSHWMPLPEPPQERRDGNA